MRLRVPRATVQGYVALLGVDVPIHHATVRQGGEDGTRKWVCRCRADLKGANDRKRNDCDQRQDNLSSQKSPPCESRGTKTPAFADLSVNYYRVFTRFCQLLDRRFEEKANYITDKCGDNSNYGNFSTALFPISHRRFGFIRTDDKKCHC